MPIENGKHKPYPKGKKKKKGKRNPCKPGKKKK